MAFQQEPKICPACGQQGNFRFIRDYEKKEKTYSLHECAVCDVQIWMPPDMADAKQSEIYKVRNAASIKNNREYHRKFLKRNEPFAAGTKILDLGCGTGEFLLQLHKQGCEVWGVDFDGEAIKAAQNYSGLQNIFVEDFMDFFKKDNLPKFDHIVFFEVIQYIKNPVEFLGNLEKLLKPGGKITVSVPCCDRMLADSNAWDFPPGPFTRWSKTATVNLFKKFGFRPLYISQIEEFKILSDSIGGKLKTGLISRNLAGQKKVKIPAFFMKALHFFGSLKEYLISMVPAGLLWIFGKITRRENGIIFAEFNKTETL